MLKAECNVFRIMAGQLKMNCSLLETGREIAETPEEAAEFEKAVVDSRSIIARVEEMLKKIDKSTLIDEDSMVSRAATPLTKAEAIISRRKP